MCSLWSCHTTVQWPCVWPCTRHMLFFARQWPPSLRNLSYQNLFPHFFTLSRYPGVAVQTSQGQSRCHPGHAVHSAYEPFTRRVCIHKKLALHHTLAVSSPHADSIVNFHWQWCGLQLAAYLPPTKHIPSPRLGTKAYVAETHPLIAGHSRPRMVWGAAMTRPLESAAQFFWCVR